MFFFFFTVYSHKLCYPNQFDVVALSVLHDTVFNVSNTHLHKSWTLEGSLLFAASMSMHNYILTMQFCWCNTDPIAVCLLPLHFHLFLPLVAEGLRFVSLLSEPLWLPVISHLFSNLSVQEQPCSGSIWQRAEVAAGPSSQPRTRPGWHSNTHRQRKIHMLEGEQTGKTHYWT